MKPKLGQWYRVARKLIRHKINDQRIWCKSKKRKPEKAMLIGVRTLSHGVVYEGLNGNVYEPFDHFRAYMFVSDIREKPFFALSHDCEFMSNWESGGVEG